MLFPVGSYTYYVTKLETDLAAGDGDARPDVECFVFQIHIVFGRLGYVTV